MNPIRTNREALASKSPEGRTRHSLLFYLISGILLASAGNPAFAKPADWHPQRVLVLPRDPSAASGLNALHAARKHRVLRSFPRQGGLQVIALEPTDSVTNALAQLRASGWVRFAEPDYVVSAAATFPNDPRFNDGTQWAFNNFGQSGGAPGADIDAGPAWDVERNASNIVVAIVDSGVRHTHEDLVENLWRNPADATPGFNALTGGHDPWDDHGHGTHLAGIVGAVADNGKGGSGVAWRVAIMACKFLDASGNGFNSDAISCIEFARTNGAHVINLSWGGNALSDAVSNALWFARQDGIVVTAAAGNNARDTDINPFYPAGIALDNIVSVGASTRLDTAWSLSNYGLSSVDLFAPGAAVYSTDDSSDSAYLSRDGSSMASAFVAGALALMRQQSPATAPAELIQRLLSTVDRSAYFSSRCLSGGRLNLRRSLDRPSWSIAGDGLPFTLNIAGVPAHSYRVLASGDLSNWQPLQTNQLSGDGTWIFPDSASTNFPWRFYRVEATP